MSLKFIRQVEDCHCDKVVQIVEPKIGSQITEGLDIVCRTLEKIKVSHSVTLTNKSECWRANETAMETMCCFCFVKTTESVVFQGSVVNEVKI